MERKNKPLANAVINKRYEEIGRLVVKHLKDDTVTIFFDDVDIELKFKDMMVDVKKIGEL